MLLFSIIISFESDFMSILSSFASNIFEPSCDAPSMSNELFELLEEDIVNGDGIIEFLCETGNLGPTPCFKLYGRAVPN